MSEIPEQVSGSSHDVVEDGAVLVDYYAGQRAAESPRRFFVGSREIGVIEIIDRWLDPDHSHFKVRGDDGGIYILRYEQGTDSWEMILYNSGTHAGARLSST
jgi:hypothetical protein